MAQGGSLIVPRWSIRVSLTISCLSQSMCTLFCDDFTFLGWISAHITCPVLGLVQTGRICRFRRSNSQRRGFIFLRNCDAEYLESGSHGIGVCLRWDNTSTNRHMVCIYNVLVRFFLNFETKLRRASSHALEICRRSKCSLLFEDAFQRLAWRFAFMAKWWC